MKLTEEQYAALPNAEKPGRHKIPPALREAPDDDCLESVFQARVLEVARLRGWRHYHTYNSRRSPHGFPDLVLARDRMLFRELKTNRGKLGKAQREWLDAIREAGCDGGVWRPRDWTAILTELY